MLTMIELNPQHYETLTTLFGETASIHIQDFLSWHPKSTTQQTIIIGNPPYNSCGFIKVPTNTTRNKKHDGKTIWTDFIKHSLKLMKNGDFLLMLVPSIWMKPDKAGIYNALTMPTNYTKSAHIQIQKHSNYLNKKHKRQFVCFY